jgi:hypothetical protein
VQLTKFTHSCVRFDDGDKSLVIDPGVFSEVDAALDGASAVLVTHEHFDHVDRDKVRAALKADSRLRMYAPAPVAEQVDAGDQVVTVEQGSEFEAAGFTVATYGGQHALIHPAIPVVANLGYLIGGVYHPGDSFAVPPAPVSLLLLPTLAPWSSGREVIDFAVSVRAPRVHQIHDHIATDVYAGIIEGHITRIAAPFGITFEHLDAGRTVTV